MYIQMYTYIFIMTHVDTYIALPIIVVRRNPRAASCCPRCHYCGRWAVGKLWENHQFS